MSEPSRHSRERSVAIARRPKRIASTDSTLVRETNGRAVESVAIGLTQFVGWVFDRHSRPMSLSRRAASANASSHEAPSPLAANLPLIASPTSYSRPIPLNRELPILSEHAVAIDALPPIHKDPFDRMLIAQAMVEGITLLIDDATVAQYPSPVQLV
jgi:hypothetical protein